MDFFRHFMAYVLVVVVNTVVSFAVLTIDPDIHFNEPVWTLGHTGMLFA